MTNRQPALFWAHGSPMNALGDNSFAARLHSMGQKLTRPAGILAISAHWQTRGTEVLDLASPPTIHDFFGFPPELYRLRYPAPGAPGVVAQVQKCLGPSVKTTSSWGLDHGAWTVLRFLYPDADIPVTQLSLDSTLNARQHFELAQKLRPLRDENILILGSGNIVHNLRDFSWEADAPVAEWAADFDGQIAQALETRDLPVLLEFQGMDSGLARHAVPTFEHYWPLLYALGASDADDSLEFPYMEMQNSTLSMRSVMFR